MKKFIDTLVGLSCILFGFLVSVAVAAVVAAAVWTLLGYPPVMMMFAMVSAGLVIAYVLYHALRVVYYCTLLVWYNYKNPEGVQELDKQVRGKTE